MRRLGDPAILLWAVVALQCAQIYGIYLPLREYASSTFFDRWDYYGDIDDKTWGNVVYLDKVNATSDHLTYINAAQNAVIRVDNTTTVAPASFPYRNSVRITTQDTYGVGTLWIMDALHVPFGCSVWPSFWTLGVNTWPYGGEIDIVEGINLLSQNQMALHTNSGCIVAPNAPSRQTGVVHETNCSASSDGKTPNVGCTVIENKPNTYGQGFANAQGGVWAVQMDVAGIFIWFWSRPDIPASIKSATSTSNMDTTTFGTPSASFPATTCNITDFFVPQKMVLLITLCGSWAGVSTIYSTTCPGTCIDNVIGPGSTFDNAYFEISYIRTYILQGLASSPTASVASASGNPMASLSTISSASISATAKTSAGSRTGGIPGVFEVLPLVLALRWMS